MALLENFIAQFDGLKAVVEESRVRVISDRPDPLFYDNQNVFIKSYLVSACSILEAFVQDLAYATVQLLDTRINEARIPWNYAVWVVGNEKAKLKFDFLESKKTRKEISNLISPNFYKTLAAFEKIGIETGCDKIHKHKDFVCSTVDKRNKVVHHNDDASDISFLDVVAIIDCFKEYATSLNEVVFQNPFLQKAAC